MTGKDDRMLAARLHDIDDLRLAEEDVPDPRPGEVLVRVGANTLCPTDVKIIEGRKTAGVELPVVPGHEIAGHVAAVGGGVEGFDVDDPVALLPAVPCGHCHACTLNLEHACPNIRIVGYCFDGGLAEYVAVPAEAVSSGCLFRAEEDLPSEALALAEPLSCVITGQWATPVSPGDVVLVMGAGPIGLLHLQLAVAAGARRVVVSQPSAERRRVAESLGADLTLDPTSEDLADVVAGATGGLGADLSIICAGAPELVDDAISVTRAGGRVNVFASLAGGEDTRIDANQVHYRNVTVSGTSNTRRRDYRTALQLITSGRVDTGAMVTHRYPLSELDDAIATVKARDALKVAVLP